VVYNRVIKNIIAALIQKIIGKAKAKQKKKRFRKKKTK